MSFPCALPEHATLGICSPAGPVKRARLEHAVECLKADGFDVKLAASVFGSSGFLSADDETRAADLHELFADPEVDAVLCSRGGYGTNRLLSLLNLSAFAESRKPFLGFSDVTALQLALYAKTGFVSFTGPLAVEWGGDLSQETKSQCTAILNHSETGNLLAPFTNATRREIEVLRAGSSVTAPLIPGNLAMMTTLLGTEWMPALKGTILFFEDISEAPYRFDRMLRHLKNAGCLEQLAALLVGDFGWEGSAGEYESQRQSVLDACGAYDFPIMLHLPYGHGRDRMTLPVGGIATVSFTSQPSLTLCYERPDVA